LAISFRGPNWRQPSLFLDPAFWPWGSRSEQPHEAGLSSGEAAGTNGLSDMFCAGRSNCGTSEGRAMARNEAGGKSRKIKDDAKGQMVRTWHGRKNDGTASASPETVTGSEDATFETAPRRKDIPRKK
jgi:hypothetical protein